jgi:hypothetical protein
VLQFSPRFRAIENLSAQFCAADDVQETCLSVYEKRKSLLLLLLV